MLSQTFCYMTSNNLLTVI